LNATGRTGYSDDADGAVTSRAAALSTRSGWPLRVDQRAAVVVQSPAQARGFPPRGLGDVIDGGPQCAGQRCRHAKEHAMGLLDSVLGNVLGGGQQAQQQGGGAGVLISILASMLANNQGRGAGGLGGLAGLAEQFQRGGLGDVMNSWVGTGENLPVSPDQLGQVLGGDVLGQLTQKTGMGQGDLLGQLSQLLPQLVDSATPGGQIPQDGLGDIGAILDRFGGAPR
jgi:uncharacterized protein YidB (DUF937 family)